VEGNIVHGSASVGVALYPADATTRDGLLTTADSAMYAEKHSRKKRRRVSDLELDTELTRESRV
jgi:predicted signal transduction protein with EAL and GGDEF domain